MLKIDATFLGESVPEADDDESGRQIEQFHDVEGVHFENKNLAKRIPLGYVKSFVDSDCNLKKA